MKYYYFLNYTKENLYFIYNIHQSYQHLWISMWISCLFYFCKQQYLSITYYINKFNGRIELSMQSELNEILNKAKELLKRVHKVIDVQLKNDRLIFCFKKTDKFFEDLEEIKKL